MVDPEAILYPTFGKFMGLGDLWEVVGINVDSGSELSSPAITIEGAPVKDAEFNCPQDCPRKISNKFPLLPYM
jgi:hypothetical protein